MTDLEDFLKLKEERNTLALRVKEIAKVKKQMLEDTSLQQSIELEVAHCLVCSEEEYKSIVEIGKKYGMQINSINDMGAFWKLQRDVSKLEAFAIECGEHVMRFNTCSIIPVLQEEYAKKHEIREDFVFNSKKWAEVTLTISKDERQKEIFQEECQYIDKFVEKLKQFKVSDDKFSALTAEDQQKLTRIAVLEKKLNRRTWEFIRFDEFKEIYGNLAFYEEAQAAAQALADLVEKSRTEKLAALNSKLDVLLPEYETLQANLRKSPCGYAAARKMYDILSKSGKVTGYATALSTKKYILSACRNDCPGKEVGLFKHNVEKLGHAVEKHEAAVMLAATRQMDETTAMRFEHLVKLESKIYGLTARRDSLNRNLF